MRWKRAQRRLETARDSYSSVHPDVSLAELHRRAGPRLVQADDQPSEVQADEFGMTDGLLDDEPGTAWTIRQQMEQETQAIRARYAAEIKRWTAVYERNPGPAPRLTEITRKMNAEIEEIEHRYYLQEARELAAADHASGRAQVRAAERQRALVNMQDFGRDLRGARYEPVQVSKATSDIFTFGGEPGSVFGSDNELFRKSQVAQKMYNANPYQSDGWVY